jgi:carbon monoxide dehydrogenase subunit G
MKVAGTYTIGAPREQVWRFLIDPERLAHCIPGAGKLEKIGENEYSGEINVGLAAVKGMYNGKVKLEDLQPPQHYRMVLDGKGKLRFAGAIDDDNDGTKGDKATPFVRQALDALIAGKEPTTSTTKPHGCTIKRVPTQG